MFPKLSGKGGENSTKLTRSKSIPMTTSKILGQERGEEHPLYSPLRETLMLGNNKGVLSCRSQHTIHTDSKMQLDSLIDALEIS